MFVSLIAVVIVMLSRLVYRKGVDLMSEIIPILCERHEGVSQSQMICRCFIGQCVSEHIPCSFDSTYNVSRTLK